MQIQRQNPTPTTPPPPPSPPQANSLEQREANLDHHDRFLGAVSGGLAALLPAVNAYTAVATGNPVPLVLGGVLGEISASVICADAGRNLWMDADHCSNFSKGHGIGMGLLIGAASLGATLGTSRVLGPAGALLGIGVGAGIGALTLKPTYNDFGPDEPLNRQFAEKGDAVSAAYRAGTTRLLAANTPELFAVVGPATGIAASIFSASWVPAVAGLGVGVAGGVAGYLLSKHGEAAMDQARKLNQATPHPLTEKELEGWANYAQMNEAD